MRATFFYDVVDWFKLKKLLIWNLKKKNFISFAVCSSQLLFCASITNIKHEL